MILNDTDELSVLFIARFRVSGSFRLRYHSVEGPPILWSTLPMDLCFFVCLLSLPFCGKSNVRKTSGVASGQRQMSLRHNPTQLKPGVDVSDVLLSYYQLGFWTLKILLCQQLQRLIFVDEHQLLVCRVPGDR